MHRTRTLRIAGWFTGLAVALAVSPVLGFLIMAACGTHGKCLFVIPGIGLDVGSAPVTGGMVDLLKTYYLPGVANAVVVNSYLHNRLAGRGVVRIEGKEAVGKMRVRNAMGLGFVPNDGVLPKPTDPGYIEIKAMPSNFWGIIGFNSNEEELSRSNLGAFKPILQEKMESLEEAAIDILNNCLYMPKTGYLGRVAGSPAAGVITLDNDGLVNTTAKTRTQWFRVGMPLAAIRSGAVVQNGMVVSAIDEANDRVTVTINGTADHGAVADNDYLVIGHLLGGSTAYNQNPTGLASWLGESANTVWNVDRSQAANALYRPQRITPAQGESLENTLGRGKATLWKRGANEGGAVDPTSGESMVWLTSGEGWRAYGAALVSVKRFVVPVGGGDASMAMNMGAGASQIKLAGGFTALDCDGVPLVKDRSCPLGHYFGMYWPDWRLHSTTGSVQLTPVVVNGSPIQKVPFHDLWIMELKASLELECQMPNRQIDVYGITMDPLV
jgi:VCBS repeat-containing protein